MEKTKPKTLETPSNFFTKQARFISAMTLEDCAENLRSRNQRSDGFFANQYNLQVDVYKVTKDRYVFALEKKIARNHVIKAEGHLERTANNETQVQLKSSLSWGIFLLLGGIFIVSILTAPLHNFGLFFPLMVILGASFTLYNDVRSREKLLAMISDALG